MKPLHFQAHVVLGNIDEADGALAERANGIASAFVGALTLGSGQFCTNPGLLLAIEGIGMYAVTAWLEGRMTGWAFRSQQSAGG
mgnify:CR=1 FL=1